MDLMIEKGNLHNNFYVLEPLQSNIVSSISQNLPILQVSSEVWHQKLGHPFSRKLHLLYKSLNVSAEKSDHTPVCKVCPLAKHKHLPFSSSNYLSNSPFDLIHLDIWDPFHVPTSEGYI